MQFEMLWYDDLLAIWFYFYPNIPRLDITVIVNWRHAIRQKLKSYRIALALQKFVINNLFWNEFDFRYDIML